MGAVGIEDDKLIRHRMEPMSKEYLKKFDEKVAPYRELWKSVRVICFAVRHGHVWMNLAVRVLLSELPPGPPRSLTDVSNFAATVTDCPISMLGDILQSVLVEGLVPIEVESVPCRVHLSRTQAGLPQGSIYNISWFGVITHQSAAALREFGVARPCVTVAAWGERTSEVLAPDLEERVNSNLRLQDHPYDGLHDLVSQLMPGIKLTDASQAPIQVLAPLPFDFRYAEPGRLIVRAPLAADGSLKVRAFFRPEGAGPLQAVKAQGAIQASEVGPFSWEAPVNWPRQSIGARMLLFFRDHEVDSIEITRWPDSGDLRAAVDTFFDPGHVHLRELLLGDEGKESLNFETAVTRLLNLLGVPMVWYGRGAVGGRPDIGGLLVEERGHVIVVGECTRERPATKFSGLAERTRELRDRYAGEAEVLPVVFTRAATPESEVRQAAEYGISLVGYAELGTLLKLLGTPVKPSEIVQFLRTLRPPYFPGLNSASFEPERWRGRY